MFRAVFLAGAAPLIAAACQSPAFTSEGARTDVPTLAVPSPDSGTADYVRQMLGYSFQIRVGRYDVAAEAVRMMEAATAADPVNAELWAQLGNAYLLEATAIGQTGGTPADGIKALSKGLAAHGKALTIDPDNIVALGGHGSTAALFSLIRQDPDLGRKGLAEMNRAVELAPKGEAHVQHLLRVLTTINLPASMRDYTVEKGDLDQIILRGEGTRQGAFVRIISGDVSIEGGSRDAARAQYVIAAKSSSPAGELARQRLAKLDAGGVPPRDIGQLRRDIVACTVCHGS